MTVSMKKWKLVVSNLCDSSILHQFKLYAANWMHALQDGRKNLGETGNLPQGASCTISAEGTVTIIDPNSRRKFTLIQELVSDFPPGKMEKVDRALESIADPNSSGISGRNIPGRLANIPENDASPLKAVKQTETHQQKDPTTDRSMRFLKDSSPEKKNPDGGSRPKKRIVQKTVVFQSQTRGNTPKKEIIVSGDGLSNVQKELKSPVTNISDNKDALRQTKDDHAAEKCKKALHNTIAYLPDTCLSDKSKEIPIGKDIHLVGPNDLHTTANKPLSESNSTKLTIENGHQSSGGDSNPEIIIPFSYKKESEEMSQTSPTTQTDSLANTKNSAQSSKSGMELLMERNEDPSEDNPLIYRERCYIIPEGFSLSEVEKHLRARIEKIQDELKESPPGIFVNLAAFDHRWTLRPKRPPLVLLQWKDWRGEPQVAFPDYENSATSKIPASNLQDLKLEEMFDALHELQFLETPGEGLEYVINLLENTIPCEAASACLYDINANEMRFVAVTGPSADKRKGEATSLSVGLFSQAARSYETTSIYSDVQNNPYFDDHADGRPGLVVGNIMYRPLALDENLLGMLQLINRVDHPQFTSEDVNIINYVAEQLAVFIHHSRLKPASSNYE